MTFVDASIYIPLMKISTLLCVLLWVASVSAKTIRLDSAQTWIRGTSFTYAPGDTFCLAAGKRPFQYFKGFHGSATQPLVITNCKEGQAIVGKGTNYGMVLDSVTYVHLTGTGASNIKYGIWIDSTDAGVGLGITNLSHHVEVDHVRISHPNFAGIMAKKDYSGNPPIPAPEFDGLHIHDNWIHDTGGEGMYLGETKSPAMLFRNVQVHHNLIQRTGWDLFQIANAIENINIHHNVMIDGGLEHEPVQANGIQIGDQSRNVRIHHNVVKNAYDNSLICMGSGDIRIDSNWFEGSGGTQAFFLDNRTFVDTGSTIRMDHNWWTKIGGVDAWRVYNEWVQVILDSNYLESGPQLIRFASGAGYSNTDTLKNQLYSANEIPPLMFVDSANGDFRLPASSVYVDWDFGFGSESVQSAIRHRSRWQSKLKSPYFDLMGRFHKTSAEFPRSP